MFKMLQNARKLFLACIPSINKLILVGIRNINIHSIMQLFKYLTIYCFLFYFLSIE